MTEEQDKVLIQAQFGLQCYDKGQITKKELESIMGICFISGEPTKDWYKHDFICILMQLSDKTLVTEDVVRKRLFNLPPKEKS